MRDRSFRSATQFFKFSPLLLRLKLMPTWVLVSLAANAVLLLTLVASVWRSESASTAASPIATPEVTPTPLTTAESGYLITASSPPVEFGERYQLTYEQWLHQLEQEAKIAAEQKPEHLTIMAGDSIALWFPQQLLPPGRSWLNQGISGETSVGLLRRLRLFNQTQPETIFVMIGINDLLRDITHQNSEQTDQTLLANQSQILDDLKVAHPQAQIVLQSILPHTSEPTWEGRDRLLKISNDRIRNLNQELEAIARQEGVYFLDLYPLFANTEGDLRPELSTDGLHLSPLGYQTWSIALQVYSREVLNLETDENLGLQDKEQLKD